MFLDSAHVTISHSRAMVAAARWRRWFADWSSARDRPILSLSQIASASCSFEQVLEEISFPATRAEIVGCACACDVDESVIIAMCTTITNRSFSDATDVWQAVRNAATGRVTSAQ